MVLSYIINLESGCKDTQTANKSVLDVSPIYKVCAHVPNKENGCKVVFDAAKVQR